MANKRARAGDQLQVGDHAPDFTLPMQAEATVRLKDFLGKSIVVLFFYGKDYTPTCTREVCAFRDSYEAFKEAGAEVIGISSDSIALHSRFVQKYQLPFILVSDAGGKVRKLYGIPCTFRLLPGRVTYIIDKQGIIRHIFSSQFTPEKHIIEAFKTLKALDTK